MAFSALMLQLEVQIFRLLMSFGMVLHRIGDPPPLTHSSSARIRSSTSRRTKDIKLLFYTPPKYPPKIVSSSPEDIQLESPSKTWPAIINFHGGGFTLGSPSDDARWATSVVQSLDAVVISVGYRLAPEHPFPTAVEDGVDALSWVLENAARLRIDKSRIALSGFSAGGNLAFAILLAWYNQRRESRESPSDSRANSSSPPLAVDSTRSDQRYEERQGLLSSPPEVGEAPVESILPDPPVAAVVSWYPPVDGSRTRAERRASNPGGPDKSLPPLLTTMFDASYLQPMSSGAVDAAHPYLSPALATDEDLRQALPRDILLYTCEWDQLFVEGEAFRTRLSSLEKKVQGRKVARVKHAWDKSPSRFGKDEIRDEVYAEACKKLKKVFEQDESD
ncbi:MAG: hypothetical protein M4579_004727 [Chaenotheca gracillima]|nr:MAG: hypothetical protein M4579_004727 [Chaenotheca gracillima]